jgi:hypothetical protein
MVVEDIAYFTDLSDCLPEFFLKPTRVLENLYKGHKQSKG